MPVVTQLFHIGGNREGSKGSNAHIFFRDIEENAVILSDDLDLIGMQKDRKLAENLFILVFLANEDIQLFDQQFDFSYRALVILMLLQQRFHVLLQSDDLLRFYGKMEQVGVFVSGYLREQQRTVLFAVTHDQIEQQQRVGDSRSRGNTDEHTGYTEYFSDDHSQTDAENDVSQRAYRQPQSDPLYDQIIRGEQIQDTDKGGAKRCYPYAGHDPAGKHGIRYVQKLRDKRRDDQQNHCDDNAFDNGGLVRQGEAGTKSFMILFSDVNAEDGADSLTDAVKEQLEFAAQGNGGCQYQVLGAELRADKSVERGSEDRQEKIGARVDDAVADNILHDTEGEIQIPSQGIAFFSEMNQQDQDRNSIEQERRQSDTADSHDRTEDDRKRNVSQTLRRGSDRGDSLVAVAVHHIGDEHLEGQDQDRKTHPEQITEGLLQNRLGRGVAAQIKLSEKGEHQEQENPYDNRHQHTKAKCLIRSILIEFTHLLSVQQGDTDGDDGAEKDSERVERRHQRDPRHSVGADGGARDDRIGHQ